MDIREIEIFKNLTDEDLDLILSKTDLIEKRYLKDETIFRAGEKTADLFYMVDGQISVYQIDNQGRRFIFQNFTRPVLFGEVYAYLKEPFDFTAVAVEETRVLVIKDFKNIFTPPVPGDFLRSYINFLSQKCLKLSKKNQITSQASLRQKIGRFILENERDGKVDLAMTREDLADYLSTTRPSLSRELSKMDEEGLIGVSGREIVLRDKASLLDL